MKDTISPTNKETKLLHFIPQDFSCPAKEAIPVQNSNKVHLDPENPSVLKKLNEPMEKGKNNEKSFTEDVMGSDSDILGAELDDEQEKTGSEDEENNGYSIGGDRHDD